MRYLLLALLLGGCTTASEDHSNTGQLECLGYCSLNIDRSHRKIETEADGTVKEEINKTGMSTE